jgi:hypothetical protein
MSVKSERRARIAEFAKECLSEHVLIPEQENEPVRMWLCRTPKKTSYWYRVVAAPGMVLIYGDVGDRMFQMYDRDAVQWARGAKDSFDYLLGKIVGRHEDRLPEAIVELAKEELGAARDDDEREHAQKVYDAVVEAEKWGEDVFQTYYDASGGDFEFACVGIDSDTSSLWAVHCLKKFVELLEARDGSGKKEDEQEKTS